jgi:hypothetical protein
MSKYSVSQIGVIQSLSLARSQESGEILFSLNQQSTKTTIFSLYLTLFEKRYTKFKRTLA